MKINPVLCMQRKALEDQGVCSQDGCHLYKFDFSKVNPEHLHLLNRGLADSKSGEDAEIAQALPQVLPYATVKCGDKYLSYSRAKGQESRLHGSLSFGFGGHVDLSDFYRGNVDLKASLERELKEELNIHPTDTVMAITSANTVLLDTTNAVGRVHVGIVYVVEVANTDSVVPEPSEIHLPKWVTKEELLAEVDRYENWSQTLINVIN